MHSCRSKLQISDASLDRGLRCQEPTLCNFLLQYIFAAWVDQSYCRTRNWNGKWYYFYIAVSLILKIKRKQAAFSLRLANDFSCSFFPDTDDVIRGLCSWLAAAAAGRAAQVCSVLRSPGEPDQWGGVQRSRTRLLHPGVHRPLESTDLPQTVSLIQTTCAVVQTHG